MYKLKEVCAFSVLSVSLIALMPGGAAADPADSRVEFRDCPKCDKRIRIDLAAGKAYVNLSRLEGASREAVAERAARLLDDAVIPPASDPKIRPLMGWSSWNTFGVDISESWRTTGDIRANWRSVKKIIEENLYLSAYAKPGHYNDMDMLEVGQLVGRIKTVFGKHGDTGLTEVEEATHFGMWCMLSSPLLIGCDVRNLPENTKRLITNPYLLAVNQNDLGCQAYVAQRDGEAYVLVKDANERFGKSRYVALCNLSDAACEVTVLADALDLGGNIDAFDLVEKADVGRFADSVTVKLEPHAAKFYRFDADKRLQRRIYEAETAYLSDYQEIRNAKKAGTAFPEARKGASGGVIVRFLGDRASNDLVWSGVKIDESREYTLAFDLTSHGERAFCLSVDGGTPLRIVSKATSAKIATVEVKTFLSAGVHTIRLFNDSQRMPDIVRMTIR
jgi:hypothetical protein